MQAKPFATLAALASLVFAATTAQATEASSGPQPMSSASRAEVIAELNRARAAGELNLPSALYGQFAHARARHTDGAPAARTAALPSRPYSTDYTGG